jgi:uncharacterized protein (DUF736 family)
MTSPRPARYQGRIGRLCTWKEQTMIIGTLKLGADNVFSGEITTLTISRKVRMVPTEATSGNAPDYRVFSGLAEIGVARTKESQKAITYYAVKFDDPTLPAPF